MWCFFLSGIFLIVPYLVIELLHLVWFYDYMGWLAGLIFLGAGTLLFIDICYWIGYRVQTIIHLRRLADDEKNVLLPFVNKNTQTQKFRIDSGSVITLLEMRILRMASNLTYDYGPFDIRGEYTIYPWVFRMLKNNPLFLKGGIVKEKGIPIT